MHGLGVATMLLLGAIAVQAQEHQADPAKIQVEVDRRDSAVARKYVTGYVKNETDYRITNVRLRVDALDSNGQQLGTTFGWVYGDVRAGGQASFRVVTPAPAPGTTFQVMSFHLVSRQVSESP
jgi:hypothetical protein